jgi:hypothetical protein
VRLLKYRICFGLKWKKQLFYKGRICLKATWFWFCNLFSFFSGCFETNRFVSVVSIWILNTEITESNRKNNFMVSRNKPKNNRNRLSFGLFRFEPKKKFVCFEDTLCTNITLCECNSLVDQRNIHTNGSILWCIEAGWVSACVTVSGSENEMVLWKGLPLPGFPTLGCRIVEVDFFYFFFIFIQLNVDWQKNTKFFFLFVYSYVEISFWGPKKRKSHSIWPKRHFSSISVKWRIFYSDQC